MYTAMLYLVFERQDGKLGHRLLRKTPIEADTLNAAKAQTTRLVKKDERMSAWVALDSAVRWSPVITENGKRFVRKTFRSVPPGEIVGHHAFVDIHIEDGVA